LRRRPLLLVVIGVVEALSPAWVWIQLAYYNGLSPLEWRAVLARVNVHAAALATIGLVAGIGLLSFRRFGYLLTQAFCAAAAVNDALLLVVEPRIPRPALLAMTAASLGAFAYLGRPRVRALFRYERLRWWLSRPRYRTAVNALVEIADQPPIGGEAIDISRGGAFVAAGAAPRPGTRCAITLASSRGPVRSPGEVAWVSRGTGRHPPGFGVRFVRPPARFRRAVRRIRRESEGAIER
jgi:hypothetical protein